MRGKYGRKRAPKLSSDGSPRAEIVDGLSPGQTAGVTEGLTAEQYVEREGVPSNVDARTIIGHMADETLIAGTRVPAPHFVARDDTGSVWIDGETDRLQKNAALTFTEQGVRMFREGRWCLRCMEPQDTAFPLSCDMCGYPMRERQIMDVAMEFEGERTLGPSKPITEYLEEQDLRVEKQKFAEKAYRDLQTAPKGILVKSGYREKIDHG